MFKINITVEGQTREEVIAKLGETVIGRQYKIEEVKSEKDKLYEELGNDFDKETSRIISDLRKQLPESVVSKLEILAKELKVNSDKKKAEFERLSIGMNPFEKRALLEKMMTEDIQETMINLFEGIENALSDDECEDEDDNDADLHTLEVLQKEIYSREVKKLSKYDIVNLLTYRKPMGRVVYNSTLKGLFENQMESNKILFDAIENGNTAGVEIRGFDARELLLIDKTECECCKTYAIALKSEGKIYKATFDEFEKILVILDVVQFTYEVLFKEYPLAKNVKEGILGYIFNDMLSMI